MCADTTQSSFILYTFGAIVRCTSAHGSLVSLRQFYLLQMTRQHGNVRISHVNRKRCIARNFIFGIAFPVTESECEPCTAALVGSVSVAIIMKWNGLLTWVIDIFAGVISNAAHIIPFAKMANRLHKTGDLSILLNRFERNYISTELRSYYVQNGLFPAMNFARNLNYVENTLR